MPKDEFDFEDPFELNGMAFLTHEDTTNDMAETFAEEFMRMGYGHKQILALFRNPHYLGPNMAFEKRGEPFIRELIADVFARWGKVVTWPVEPGFQPGGKSVESTAALGNSEALNSASADPHGKMPVATDPTGAPIPEYTV